MPFLRVIRDKRGYETTYLMHWFREGSRQRSRVLYVFRTPGSARVGREALDPAIRQALESRHPDIDFDWKALVDNQQVIESAPETRRPRKRPRDDDEEPAPAVAPEARRAADPPPRQPPRVTIPSALEGGTPDEQVAFLARWYAVVRERIPARTGDPARQQALMALAERLNPTAWTDADQITSGLQQAVDALDRLSHVFAKRRRRPRRPGGSPPALSALLEPSVPPEPQALPEPAAPPEPPEPSSHS